MALKTSFANPWDTQLLPYLKCSNRVQLFVDPALTGHFLTLPFSCTENSRHVINRLHSNERKCILSNGVFLKSYYSKFLRTMHVNQQLTQMAYKLAKWFRNQCSHVRLRYIRYHRPMVITLRRQLSWGVHFRVFFTMTGVAHKT